MIKIVPQSVLCTQINKDFNVYYISKLNVNFFFFRIVITVLTIITKIVEYQCNMKIVTNYIIDEN